MATALQPGKQCFRASSTHYGNTATQFSTTDCKSSPTLSWSTEWSANATLLPAEHTGTSRKAGEPPLVLTLTVRAIRWRIGRGMPIYNWMHLQPLTHNEIVANADTLTGKWKEETIAAWGTSPGRTTKRAGGHTGSSQMSGHDSICDSNLLSGAARR